jgi:hypothetical protein
MHKNINSKLFSIYTIGRGLKLNAQHIKYLKKNITYTAFINPNIFALLSIFLFIANGNRIKYINTLYASKKSKTFTLL